MLLIQRASRITHKIHQKALLYIQNDITYIFCSKTSCFLTGKLLHTLTHDKLPSYYEDISVRGNQLAVSGWKDYNVLLFNLQLEE